MARPAATGASGVRQPSRQQAAVGALLRSGWARQQAVPSAVPLLPALTRPLVVPLRYCKWDALGALQARATACVSTARAARAPTRLTQPPAQLLAAQAGQAS